jgi:AAA-like domain
MEKFFNNAGPQLPDDNYTLDPLRRIKLDELQQLIDQKRYFIMHAPRQTGKTTAMYALMRHYNAGTQYRALYVNLEGGQAARENVDMAMKGFCSSFNNAAQLHLKDGSVDAVFQSMLDRDTWTDALVTMIKYLSSHDAQQPSKPRPLILMIDEIDALIGDTLISVLRQIRAGYADRPHAFPQTVILCGVRDVRDYRIHSSATKEIITGGSAFNIKAESIRLGNFSEAEVNELYQQHTDATGQVFTEEARSLAWEYTEGQPWLVNALAYDITFRMKPMRDRSVPITGEIMRQAKERMVLSRATHLDQLIDKLQEPRVYRVIAPLLEGEGNEATIANDDTEYCIDLGLVRRLPNSRHLVIANAIYREVIPRELTDIAQTLFASTQAPQAWYIDPDGTPEGKLNLTRLLQAFQQFYRENSEHWLKNMSYREAAPQLLLQAYLQRIVNGGGRIEREYGLGRGRTDLYVTWPACPEPRLRAVIEIKVKRPKDSLASVIEKGRAQTAEYQQRCGASEAHLLIFNTDPDLTWDEKISHTQEPMLTIWGC